MMMPMMMMIIIGIVGTRFEIKLCQDHPGACSAKNVCT